MSPSDVSLGKGKERMVGKAILRGASSNSASDKQKKGKSCQLDQFMPALSGVCPVCFILGREMVPSHPVGDQAESGHRPFYHCPFDQLLDHGGSTPGPTFAGFVDFRRMIDLRKGFYYCYTCCMPQNKNGNGLEPACHADWSRNCTRYKLKEGGSSTPQAKGRCPWSNIIQASLYVMYFHRQAMEELLQHFPYTTLEDPSTMTLAEWANWLNTDLSDEGEYWKGLEVFLFKATAYGLIA